MLTIETIRAAQTNDLDATVTVVNATESRVSQLAERAARRMAPHGGHRYMDYRDEFSQVGRTAVWASIGRFAGDTPDAFFAYMYATIERTLLDSVRSERNGGADKDAVKVFGAMLEMANGDPYRAEKMCHTVPDAGRRLSADRASAARMAWQGCQSIDAPRGTDGASGSYAESLSTDYDGNGYYEIPAVPTVTPKVGRGAVISASLSLAGSVPAPVDQTDRETLRSALVSMADGHATESAVEALEELVCVPVDPRTRRTVLGALGVLRAAVSTATEHDVTDDLTNVSDRRQAETHRKIGVVREILDVMGEAQRAVLSCSFGIRGARLFGHGDSGDDAGMAAHLSEELPAFGDPRGVQRLREARTKGLRAFAKRFVKALALTRPALAAELENAAVVNLRAAGRK